MKKFALIFVGLLISQTTYAQEWHQWRGPSRDGSVSTAPSSLPKTYRQSWQVEVGEGYSSPVISSGRVFINSRRDPNEVVMAINLADGKVLWEKQYPASFKKNQYAVEMAKGPNSTPLVLGNRLFTLGVSGVLVAWDTKTGLTLEERLLEEYRYIKAFLWNSCVPTCR